MYMKWKSDIKHPLKDPVQINTLQGKIKPNILSNKTFIIINIIINNNNNNNNVFCPL